MTNLKFKQTLTAGVVLAMALCPQSWAHSWATKTCGDPNGYACYNCGSDCTATLYQDGRLVVSGTGTVNGGSGGNSTFSNSNIKPTSLIIQEGITIVESNALWGISTITSLDIADSVSHINPDGLHFGGSGLIQLTIGANSPLDTTADFNGYRMPIAEKFEVNCRGNMSKCKEKESLFTDFGAQTISYVKRDEDGNLLERWDWDSDGKGIAFDSNGNIIAKYGADGDLLASYDFASDGSVYIRDANGKLTGAKKTSPFTPAEAAALIKKGNDNKVTLTFK